jgi:hypothetical protein
MQCNKNIALQYICRAADMSGRKLLLFKAYFFGAASAAALLTVSAKVLA